MYSEGGRSSEEMWQAWRSRGRIMQPDLYIRVPEEIEKRCTIVMYIGNVKFLTALLGCSEALPES